MIYDFFKPLLTIFSSKDELTSATTRKNQITEPTIEQSTSTLEKFLTREMEIDAKVNSIWIIIKASPTTLFNAFIELQQEAEQPIQEAVKNYFRDLSGDPEQQMKKAIKLRTIYNNKDEFDKALLKFIAIQDNSYRDKLLQLLPKDIKIKDVAQNRLFTKYKELLNKKKHEEIYLKFGMHKNKVERLNNEITKISKDIIYSIDYQSYFDFNYLKYKEELIKNIKHNEDNPNIIKKLIKDTAHILISNQKSHPNELMISYLSIRQIVSDKLDFDKAFFNQLFEQITKDAIVEAENQNQFRDKNTPEIQVNQIMDELIYKYLDLSHSEINLLNINKEILLPIVKDVILDEIINDIDSRNFNVLGSLRDDSLINCLLNAVVKLECKELSENSASNTTINREFEKLQQSYPNLQTLEDIKSAIENEILNQQYHIQTELIQSIEKIFDEIIKEITNKIPDTLTLFLHTIHNELIGKACLLNYGDLILKNITLHVTSSQDSNVAFRNIVNLFFKKYANNSKFSDEDNTLEFLDTLQETLKMTTKKELLEEKILNNIKIGQLPPQPKVEAPPASRSIKERFYQEIDRFKEQS